MYCEIILFHGHKILWIDDNRHVRDTKICVFQITFDIIRVNKYFVGILNSWIAQITKYTKVNVQWIKIFHSILLHFFKYMYLKFKYF